MNSCLPTPEHAHLISKLSSLSPLEAQDIAALADLPLRTKTFRPGLEIVAQGAETADCCLILDGLVARCAFTPSGARQIVSFHLPGDLPDRDGLHLRRVEYAICVISAARVAFIPHSALREVAKSHPNVAQALTRDAARETGILQQWIVNLGRRSAKERMAHLICEMFTRMEALGHAQGARFQFPVTQSQLGDALGLSTVHINRILHELAAGGLLTWRRSEVAIHQLDDLRRIADFNPRYLQVATTAHG